MNADKVGRNDPCPCGTGQKYKRCCAAKDAAARSAELSAQAAARVAAAEAAAAQAAEEGAEEADTKATGDVRPKRPKLPTAYGSRSRNA